MTTAGGYRLGLLGGLLALFGGLGIIANGATALPAATPLDARGHGGSALTLAASDEEIARFFDQHVSAELRRSEIPGASLVVVRQGRPILIRGYGQADLAAGRPLRGDATLMRQASITKLLVWILVMQLVEEGRLALDEDINKYLGFEIPQRFGQPITMRHLMTHSAGFADKGPSERRGSLGQELAESLPERVYAPGTTIAYSNYGAALAAHMVERVRDRPFDALAEELLRKLAMHRSSIADPLPDPLRGMLASGYSASAREAFPFEPLSELVRPVGALSAPADDMGRLVAMFLSDGRVPGGSILRPETVQRMMDVDKALGPGLRSGLGLGFIVGEHRGVRYAGHGGSLPAGATDLELLPEQELGWNIAFNGRGLNGAAVEARGRLVRAVIERFVAPPPAAIGAVGPSTATDAEGIYFSTRRPHSGPERMFDVFATVTAKANKDGTLTIRREEFEHRLLPQGRDRFVDPATGALFAASRDADGTVVRLASPMLNNVAEFERAPILVPWVLPTIGIAVVVFVAGAAVRLVLRMRGRRNVSEREQGRGWGLRSLAAAAPWLLITAVIAWPAAMMSGFGGGTVVTATLHILSLVAVAGAAALALNAVRGKTGERLPSRVARALEALAGTALAVVLIAFDLTIF